MIAMSRPEDPTRRATSFGQAAEAYERGRPGYPPEAVAWLLAPLGAGPARVLDLGAGTGKLTRALHGAGHDVTAADPDPAMLEALSRALPGVPARVGRAEALPFEDGAFDAVVMGQAWHWVDPARAVPEIARVLRPGGVLGLVWNIRDDAQPWVARMTAVMEGSAAEALIASDEGPRVGPPFGPLAYSRFGFSRPMTREALFAMAHSRSRLITADDATRARIDAELAALFDGLPELADGGAIALPYLTHAFRARLPL